MGSVVLGANAPLVATSHRRKSSHLVVIDESEPLPRRRLMNTVVPAGEVELDLKLLGVERVGDLRC